MFLVPDQETNELLLKKLFWILVRFQKRWTYWTKAM